MLASRWWEGPRQKPPSLRRIRPATVCIAALCEGGTTAILVADRRVGVEFIEADTAQKIGRIHSDWLVLLAGNDFSAAQEVRLQAAVSLKARTDNITARVVRDALADAYQMVRLQRAEAEHLKSRGWSLDEFKQKGLASFPEATFAEIDGAIRRYDLGVDLIACGFPSEHAYIIAVNNPGIGSFETDSHFAAIGSGYTVATSSLFVRKFHRAMKLPEALYYVYEAKVAAEKASGVGQPTHILILRRSQAMLSAMGQNEQDGLRSIWEKLKPGNLSEADLQQIESMRTVQRLLQSPDEPPNAPPILPAAPLRS